MPTLFIACAPGLEPLLADEVRGLGADPTITAGGVEVAGDAALLYRANLELGLALKVLVRLGRFEARGFPALIHGAAALPWPDWCRPGTAVRFKVTARKSRLYHSGAVAERLRKAIEEHVGIPLAEPADDPALTVHARLERDVCTISIDASGELLSRRGYRLATGKAPLREDLARALVILSGWDRTGPLIDPFAGAGTIAIEAALLATRTPPGHQRRFAFMDAPSFDDALWRRVLERALADRRGLEADIIASDRDAGAVAMATDNAERAGFALRFHEAPLGRAPWVTAPPAVAGALVTNPPYGRRVGDRRKLERLYRSLGDRVRALPSDTGIALAVGSPRLAAATGLGASSAVMTDHGGSKIYLMIRSPSAAKPG